MSNVKTYRALVNCKVNGTPHVAGDVLVFKEDDKLIPSLVESGTVVDLDESLKTLANDVDAQVEALKAQIKSTEDAFNAEVKDTRTKAEKAVKVYYKMAEDAEIEKNADAFKVIEAYKATHENNNK